MQANSPQDPIDNELALAIADERAALWLGPDWLWTDDPDHRHLANHGWVGIWSESREPCTARFLSTAWDDRPFQRTFVEVPGQLHETLNADFKFARVCPYFYLSGRDPDTMPLTPRRQLILRASHVDQIERLGPATLVIAGIHDPTHLGAVLRDDLERCVSRLRAIIVTGVHVSDSERYRESLAPLGGLVAKIALVEDTLAMLLSRLALSRDRPTVAGPQLLVRNKPDVHLHGLLRTDPPLDQYFHIITAQDLRPAEATEDRHQLMVHLLSGQAMPWRAFRHDLHWKRPLAETLKERVSRLLHNMTGPNNPPSVRCLNLEADPGAGLTTILQVLAFHAADNGYPTLVARDSIQRFQFDVLRTFLIGLDHIATGIPAVLIVDAPVTQRDPTDTFKELPRRLRANGRRVLLIRGSQSLKDLPTPSAMHVDFDVPRLQRDLPQDEYGHLKDWVSKTYARFYPTEIQAKMKTVDEWATKRDQQTTPIPLLVALYFLLQRNLRQAADLGKHLINDLNDQLAALVEGQKDKLLPTGIPIRTTEGAVKRLMIGAHKPAASDRPRQIAEAVTVIAALARLDEFVPLSVLAKVIGADTTDMYRALGRLEQARLIRTDDLAQHDFSNRRLMPATYYEDWETASLVHPLYGSMTLDSILTDDAELSRSVIESPLCQEILKIHQESDTDARPIPFFAPIFRALEPGIPSHRWFAEYVSMQYLRPQRHAETDENLPPKHELEKMMSAFEWLKPSLLECSGPLLHSRALTCRALGFRQSKDHLDVSRTLFQRAIHDIDLAIEVEAERPGGEDLGNLKTTCGLIHRDWAIRELNCLDGSKADWHDHLRQAKLYLEAAYELRQNSYPAHALANLVVHQLEYQTKRRQPPPGKEDWIPSSTPADFARNLTEAMDLLSHEPELAFQETWNHTKARAVVLLDDAQAAAVIQELKDCDDEMGYALDALRILRGIPRSPTANPQEKTRMSQAGSVLAEAQDNGLTACALGNLLRYAIFSSQPERDLNHDPWRPAYQERHKLMRRLIEEAGATYLKDPTWRYDAAMLCFQNREIAEGRRHFSELRRGYRYMQVPSERTAPWVRSPDDPRPLRAWLRISRVDRFEDRGWGRLIDDRLGYGEEIPFRVSSFTSKGIYRVDQFQPGNRIEVRIQLRPAGPYAIPADEKDRHD